MPGDDGRSGNAQQPWYRGHSGRHVHQRPGPAAPELPGPAVLQADHRVSAGGQVGGEWADVRPVVRGPPEPAVQEHHQRPLGYPGGRHPDVEHVLRPVAVGERTVGWRRRPAQHLLRVCTHPGQGTYPGGGVRDRPGVGKDGDMSDQQQPQDGRTVVVVGPDGRPVSTMEMPPDQADGDRDDPGSQIEQPAKVMRIGSMIKQLLEEVRAAPLDEAGRQRLREIHSRSITELEEGLAPELREELDRLTLPFDEDTTPSEAELRIAQAQLVGWLEGLFHGIQAALVAQQMAARIQLEQMRTGRPALPSGPGGARIVPGMVPPGTQPDGSSGPTGQYL